MAEKTEHKTNEVGLSQNFLFQNNGLNPVMLGRCLSVDFQVSWFRNMNQKKGFAKELQIVDMISRLLNVDVFDRKGATLNKDGGSWTLDLQGWFGRFIWEEL